MRLRAVTELKNNEIYTFLCRYKGIASDTKMTDAKKGTLTLRWAQIRSCTSPHVTPYNSSSESDTDNDAVISEVFNDEPSNDQFHSNYTSYNLDAPGDITYATERDEEIGLLMNIISQH